MSDGTFRAEIREEGKRKTDKAGNEAARWEVQEEADNIEIDGRRRVGCRGRARSMSL